MARTTLLSGSPNNVRMVSAALKEAGCSVIGSDTSLGSSSLDCYVQLQPRLRSGRGTAVERVGEFLAGGLLARIAVAAAVLPALRPGATVVLVDGFPPADDIPDDPHARFDLLCVVGQAVVEARNDTQTFVVGAGLSPEEIAEVAVEGARRRGSLAAPLSDDLALSYADWKLGMLSASDALDWEHSVRRVYPPNGCRGWSAAGDHRRAVISFSGADVTPLVTGGLCAELGDAAEKFSLAAEDVRSRAEVHKRSLP